MYWYNFWFLSGIKSEIKEKNVLLWMYIEMCLHYYCFFLKWLIENMVEENVVLFSANIMIHIIFL